MTIDQNREAMTEPQFYAMLQRRKLPYVSWPKEPYALFQEMKDGVRVYETDEGVIREAECMRIIAVHADRKTGITSAFYEKYREFVGGKREERPRRYTDPRTGLIFPIAISETLKGRGRRKEHVMKAALRALGKKEEGGLPNPDPSRLTLLGPMVEERYPSTAFTGVTTINTGTIARYDLTRREWNAWGEEFLSIDENNIVTALGKTVLPLAA